MKGSVNFRFLSGDVNWKDYGGKFISKRFANCPNTKPGDDDFEFYWWLVLEVRKPGEIVDNGRTYKCYDVTLSVVSPDRCPVEERDAALRYCGLDLANWVTMGLRHQAEVIYDYGIRAQMGEWTGNNLSQLMKQAREKARELGITFGFAMDKAQNRIGATGWDFLEGNILGGMKNASMREIVRAEVDRQDAERERQWEGQQ